MVARYRCYNQRELCPQCAHDLGFSVLLFASLKFQHARVDLKLVVLTYVLHNNIFFVDYDKLKEREDPALVLKVQSLLAEGNPDVVAYAAKLGDEHVIREYLKNYPNEVCNNVHLTGYHFKYCLSTEI